MRFNATTAFLLRVGVRSGLHRGDGRFNATTAFLLR
jgi:hypothetical protein